MVREPSCLINFLFLKILIFLAQKTDMLTKKCFFFLGGGLFWSKFSKIRIDLTQDTDATQVVIIGNQLVMKFCDGITTLVLSELTLTHVEGVKCPL